MKKSRNSLFSVILLTALGVALSACDPQSAIQRDPIGSAGPSPSPTSTTTPAPTPAPTSTPTPSPTSIPTIQRGKLLSRTLSDDSTIQYLLYVPTRGSVGAPIFVTVHGISLNYDEHATRFMPFAEKYGVVLIAPYFPDTRFDDYQRLGPATDSRRADLALKRIVQEVRGLTQASGGKFYLFGYSGGAQFTHRYSMAYPDDIARYAVGAAGWYTFPDTGYNYPQGITKPGISGISFVPSRFLQVPGAVLVGDEDVELTDSLNQDPEINAQQGTTRYERGGNWIEAMNAAAAGSGMAKHYRFQSLSGCDHSFGRCMSNSRMGELTFEWLFGPAP